MAQLQYRTPQKRTTSGDAQLSEFLPGLILIVLGLLISGIWAFRLAGTRGAMLVMGIIFGLALAQAVLGILAAYITASVMSTSFGELRSAGVKLAGIIIFTSSLGLVIPFGGLVVLFVYLGLLMWMFGLEMFEAIVFAIVLAVVRFAAMFAIVAMFS